MCTALGVVDIVTETENILLELLHILEGDLHHDAVSFSLEKYRIMKLLFFCIDFLYETDDSLRLLE